MTRKLTLTTFGGLSLLRNDDVAGPVTGQRRPLAVLAILADAGAAGVHREKLSSLLWTDAEPERGRRALAQVLYSIRKTSGADSLFSGVADVRLNRDAVDVDVTMFSGFLRAGDLESAVNLYSGPFCDGFSVPGAPEFERWLEVQRHSYAASAASVLRRLIENARSERAIEREVEWCARLAALDGHDPRAVVLLMDALAGAGDHAAAVRAGRLHEKIMREDLDLPPGEEVSNRLARLTTVKAPPAPPASRSPASTKRVAATPAETAIQETPVATPTRRRLPLIRKAVVAIAASAIIVLAAVAVGSRYFVRPVAATPPMRPDVVAVLPFDVAGADADLKFLGDGAANLLARWLRASDRLRAVDPGTVLAILDTLERPSSISLVTLTDRARMVGRKARAGEVIIGRISGNQNAISIAASVYDVETGEERASAQVAGGAEQLADLMETVATRLVAQAVVGAERANAFADARFPVLRAYLDAEAAFHNDDYKGSIALYERALALDPGFAPAALGLAIVADRRNAAEQHERGLALAWASREGLGSRDRLYLEALAGPRYPQPSSIRELLNAWERAVALNPDRASAWTELGERFLFDAGFIGIRDGHAKAASAFRKALELDRENPRAVRGLLRVDANRNDLVEIRSLLSTYDLAAVGGELTGYLKWRLAIALRDTAALRRARHQMGSMTETSIRAIAMSSQHELIGRGDGQRALELLAGAAVLSSDQLDVLLAQHSFATNAGDVARALEVTAKMEDTQPASRTHLRLRILDALYVGGDTLAANHAVTELERIRSRHAGDAEARSLAIADLCVLAQWEAAPWRETTIGGAQTTSRRVRSMVRELRGAQLPTNKIAVAASPTACGDLVSAMVAVKLRSADARAKVQALDDLVLSGPAQRDGTAWANLATAKLYDAIDDPARALAVVRQRPFMKGWPRYLASSLKDEAMYAGKIGDTAAEKSALDRLKLLSSRN